MTTGHIDGHIHLSFIPPALRPAFFQKCRECGTSGFILGGYNPPDWEAQLEIKKSHPDFTIHTCVGLHPWHILNTEEPLLRADFTLLERTAPSAAFIGETGLDRFRESSPAKDQLQVEFFKKHLELARKLDKPVVLHIVQAHTQALALLAQFQGLKGFVHGFAGAPELAERYLKLGYFLSVGPGILSEKGYRKLKDTVAALPLESFVLESDSPESPENCAAEPALLTKVAAAVAQIKKVSREKVLKTSNENLRRLAPAADIGY